MCKRGWGQRHVLDTRRPGRPCSPGPLGSATAKCPLRLGDPAPATHVSGFLPCTPPVHTGQCRPGWVPGLHILPLRGPHLRRAQALGYAVSATFQLPLLPLVTACRHLRESGAPSRPPGGSPCRRGVSRLAHWLAHALRVGYGITRPLWDTPGRVLTDLRLPNFLGTTLVPASILVRQ